MEPFHITAFHYCVYILLRLPPVLPGKSFISDRARRMEVCSLTEIKWALFSSRLWISHPERLLLFKSNSFFKLTYTHITSCVELILTIDFLFVVLWNRACNCFWHFHPNIYSLMITIDIIKLSFNYNIPPVLIALISNGWDKLFNKLLCYWAFIMLIKRSNLLFSNLTACLVIKVVFDMPSLSACVQKIKEAFQKHIKYFKYFSFNMQKGQIIGHVRAKYSSFVILVSILLAAELRTCSPCWSKSSSWVALRVNSVLGLWAHVIISVFQTNWQSHCHQP